jgi:hypothetical protein
VTGRTLPNRIQGYRPLRPFAGAFAGPRVATRAQVLLQQVATNGPHAGYRPEPRTAAGEGAITRQTG